MVKTLLKKRKESVAIILIFFVLAVWIFSSWPWHVRVAHAAVSVISGGAINGSVTNGNNVTLTFPVGVQQGDVVIVYGGHPFRSGAPLGPLTAGYTVIASHTAAAPSFGAWYKVMGASPDANVVGRGTGNTADATAYGAYILRGVDPSIFDQTAVTVGPTTSTNPNPGSIITQTSGAWVLALAGSQVIDASPGTPTNYTNLNTKSGNDSNDITIAGVTREIASPASEDPPAYPTWSSGAWYAITIALKPEPPSNAPPATPILSETPAFPNEETFDATPVLGNFSSTDPESDAIEYEIQWDEDANFGTPVTKTSSNFPGDAGWGASTFASGASVSYTVQPADALTNGQTYWWRVRARDPAGSNTWSAYSLHRSFTVNTTLSTDQWSQTTGDQFGTDTLTETAVTGGEVKIQGW